MDWKRSKNILILALLVTNIVLFILSGAAEKLFTPQSEEDPLLDLVISMLSQRGIKSTAVLPSNIKSIQAIDLEYDEVDSKVLADKLFDKKYEEQQGLYVGVKGDLLVVALERELRYEWPKALWPLLAPLEETKAWQIGEVYLTDLGFDHAELVDRTYSLESDHVILEWRQRYGTYFLEEAYIKIRIAGDQVVSLERRWFDTPLPQETEYRVISAAKALYLAAEQIADSGMTDPVVIENMDLGYKLETGTLTTGITSGEASPYWRVKLSDGRILFVEAVE